MLTPELIASLGGAASVREFPPATGLAFHSARVHPGDVFFALPGAAGHGIVYAEAALAAGAAFIVSDVPHPRGLRVDDPYDTLLALGRHARAQLRGAVIGVTGSAGKTTTKTLVAAALEASASPGNLNTPPALAQILVDQWLAGRTGMTERLVLELGIDHPGEMNTLVELTRPSHAVLTLISEGHLSGLGDVQTVAREKTVLLHAADTAFVSVEALPFLTPAQQVKSISYGLADEPGAELQAIFYREERGTRLELFGQRCYLPYPGRAVARSAVVALALARHFDLDLAQAARRIAAAKLEPGRLQHHKLAGWTLLDDSYNSNPASAREALTVLKNLPRPHSAILGDMLELGARSEALHRELGRATKGLDHVITIGEEARFIAIENPAARHFLTVAEVLEHVATLPRTGSLLIKGSRGMKLERIVEVLLAKESETV